MKKYNLFLFIIMISGLFSCQSIGEAGDTVDEFYALQSQGKYDEMLKYVHKKTLNQYGKETWENAFKYKTELIGKQNDYKQTRRGIRTHNGTTFVGLYYDCYGDKQTCYDYFVLQKVKDEFFIREYYFNMDKDMLPDFTPPKPGSKPEKNMTYFHKLQKQGKYDDMLVFFHKDLIKKAGKDKLLQLLKTKAQIIGKQKECKKLVYELDTKVGKKEYRGFHYECIGDKQKIYEAVLFKKDGIKYKIHSLYLNPDESKLPDLREVIKRDQ